MQLIDLTCPLDEAFTVPQWPSLERLVRYHTISSFPRNGRRTTEVTLTTHTGTHVDAPSHVVEEGKALHELPLASFFGDTIVLDILKGEKGKITAQDLEEAGQNVRRGDIVLIHSGWGRFFWKEPRSSAYLADYGPGLVEDAALWLVDKGVKAVGVDWFSIGHKDNKRALTADDYRQGLMNSPEPVHQHLLKKDIVILEQLINLDLIAGQRVKTAFFPLHFFGFDGSPVRAVAILE